MPPLWYGLGRPESLDWVAKRGINIIGNGPAALTRRVTDRYRALWQEAGKSAETLPMMGMSRHMIIADTDADARELARPAYQQWIDNLLLLWRKHNIMPTANFPENFEAADAAGVCLVGSLATVRDKLRAQVSEAGVNYLLCRVAFGDLPKRRFVEDGRTGAARDHADVCGEAGSRGGLSSSLRGEAKFQSRLAADRAISPHPEEPCVAQSAQQGVSKDVAPALILEEALASWFETPRFAGSSPDGQSCARIARNDVVGAAL